MNKVFKIILALISVIYPFAMLAGFLWLKTSPRVLILGLMGIGVVFFLANSGNMKEKGYKSLHFWVMISLVATLSGVTYFTESVGLLKLYPFIMNIFFLGSFGFTLLKGPSMIYRFALAEDSTLDESDDRERIERYCRIITWIWCGFFANNASLAVFTAFLTNDVVWGVYNGVFTYILIGLLFGGEILYRKLIFKI